ncbi:hypothetical protein C8A05DRAFT_42054 [Staphylotrichum tortipilum]|uniref:Hikeshi-like domain-containing protein n=1 Tax=Staphylotrichum tortipilum TaxID=2831512 RepID=A0AAN6RVW8_9PEZI|nr:hypothetical protein C8A05DRAFT_42054 [Staphylotrichum longicolle]
MSQPLFGLIPAGQPMLITPTQSPTPTSFLYAIPPSVKPFSHIVVVLLPGVTLPPATAAAIYLVTPPTNPSQTEPNSHFLGGIGPGKESAIFKINAAAAAGAGGNVVIGVSVEPADSVAARISTPTPSTAGALVPAAAAGGGVGGGQQPSTLVLAQRIIKNAFNFLASFSGTTAAGAGGGQVEMVPLKAFEEWWRKFEGRVRSDPGFLERDE